MTEMSKEPRLPMQIVLRILTHALDAALIKTLKTTASDFTHRKAASTYATLSPEIYTHILTLTIRHHEQVKELETRARAAIVIQNQACPVARQVGKCKCDACVKALWGKRKSGMLEFTIWRTVGLVWGIGVRNGWEKEVVEVGQGVEEIVKALDLDLVYSSGLHKNAEVGALPVLINGQQVSVRRWW